MGHFFNPPPGPIVAATAAQPYAGGKLTPPGIPVNNPPFNFRPFVPPYPGATILISGIAGSPQGAAAAVTAQVPYTNWWYPSVLQAWQSVDTLPILPRYLNPTVTAVPVNNPPFTGRTHLPNILAQWQAPDPSPPLPGKLSPGIPGQSVDNPPRLSRPPQPLYPVDYLAPQQQRYVPQTSVVVAAQGPYNNLWLASVIQSWFAADPQPTLPRNLNPSFLGVRVDNPPFGLRWQSPVYPSPPILISGIVGVPPTGAAPTVVQNPYANYWLATVVQSWFGSDPLPTLPRYLNPTVTAVRVDNPPFNQRTFIPSYPEAYVAPQGPVRLPQGAPVVVSTQGPYSNYWLATVLEAWQANDPPPTLPRYSAAIPGWSVDNPPVSEGTLVITWLPADHPPTLPRRLPASLLTVPVNNPPFSHYGRSAWVADIIVRAWQPPDPLPTLSNKLNPSALAVPVNNPPFTSRTELPGILAAWAAWPPSQFPTPYSVPPQVQPAPPPPPVTAQFTVSGPDVSVYLQEFSYDVVYTDAPITKRTV